MKKLLLISMVLLSFASCHENVEVTEDGRAPSSARATTAGTLVQSNAVYKIKDSAENVTCYAIRGNADGNGAHLQCFKD